MARISSYPFDTNITDNDAWIGTNAANRSTKQFTASAVANYLNLSGKVSVGGQMMFSLHSNDNIHRRKRYYSTARYSVHCYRF